MSIVFVFNILSKSAEEISNFSVVATH